MKKLIALFMAICFLTVSLSSCKNSENSLINSESLTSTMNEQNKPTEPNPASDFEYQVNSAQTGILINKYVGSSSYVIIPSHIDDLPVLSLKGVPDEQYPTSIAEGVFEDKDIQSVVIPETIKVILGLTSLNEPIFHDVPNLETVVFKEGREEIVGYAFIQTDASIAMIVPDGVKKFSSSPFLITPSSNITITFLGDAPEIVEDDAPNWFGNPIVYYDSNKDGWETFDWKDKVDMNPLPQN